MNIISFAERGSASMLLLVNKSARAAAGWLGEAAASRSARRRLNATLRNACRALGLKRGKGLGMLGIGNQVAAAAVIAAVLTGFAPQANAGIFVNDGNGDGCQYVSGDDTKTFWDLPIISILKGAATIVFSIDPATQKTIQCNPNAPAVTTGFDVKDSNGNVVVPRGGTIVSNNKVEQTGRVLFYKSDAGIGTDSVSVGGELFVNSGKIGLGGGNADRSMVIGNPTEYKNSTTLVSKLGRKASQGEVAKADGSVQRFAPGKDLAGKRIFIQNDNGDLVCGEVDILGVGSNCKSDTNVQYLTTQVQRAGASATGKNAQVFGNDAKAVGENALALGYGAQSLHANSVGGGSSFTNGVFNAPTYSINTYGRNDGPAKVDVRNVGDAIRELNENDATFVRGILALDQSINDRIKGLAPSTTGVTWDEERRVFTANPKIDATNRLGPEGQPTNGPEGQPTIDDGLHTITDVKDGKIVLGSTDVVTGNQLNATNEKVTGLEKSAVKLETGKDGKTTNTVKLQGGDPNAPVLIKNVADAKESTDGVNKGQLDGVEKKIAEHSYSINERVAKIETTTASTLTSANGYTDQKFDEAKDYTDKQFNKLNSDIGAVRKEAYQAAAIGLAAASLRFDSAPGKISVATGGGLWQGQAALAFGAGYTSESGNVRANVTGAVSGEGVGVGAGVSFTLN
jgi:autotransporter adhesin